MSIAKHLRDGVFYRADDIQIVDVQTTQELMMNAARLIEELQYERDQLKATLFEAQQALLNEGMRANALNAELLETRQALSSVVTEANEFEARILGGIRVYATDNGPAKYRCTRFADDRDNNATIILDEGVEL